MHRWLAPISDGNVQCIFTRGTSTSILASCHHHTVDKEVKSWCDGHEELQAVFQPHFRLQGCRAVGIGTACRFPTGKQLDASLTVVISKTSFDWDCVASGHLWPSQLHGQARGNASRSFWSQCRVRLCRSWYPVVTTGAHIWHHWISTQLDKNLPLGPAAASDIPRTAVCRHEVDLRCPTRFRAWTSSVPSSHSRIAGYHKREDMKAHSYADDTQVHLSTGASDVRTAGQRFVSCTEKIEAWMSCNRLKMNVEKTQVIWIGSRQQLAKVDIVELQLLSANVHFSTTVSTLEFIFIVSWPCGITWQRLAAHVFSSWGSCGPSEALWRLMQPRRWHRRSWEVGLTAELVYYMVSAGNSCDVCRVYRMRRLGSSLVQENTITSLLCCVIYIGYLCDKG